MDTAHQAAEFIRTRLSGAAPHTLIVLGSGLASLGDELDNPAVLAYEDIPGFSSPTTPGHVGELVLGDLANQPVAVMKGKIFSFEAAGINGMRAPIRAMHLLGVDTLFYSASVGSMMPEADVGALVMVTDHINAMGTSPLLGEDESPYGDKFPDMAVAYDEALRILTREIADDNAIPLHEGVYGAVRGPAFETPAEVRMLKSWGVDVVGMSLVPEVLLARHCGMRVVAIANVTNLAVGMSAIPVNHEQTLQGAEEAKRHLRTLLAEFVSRRIRA